MEVDQRLLGNLRLDVALLLGLLQLLDGGVVAGHVGVVVLGVVELHNLAADGGLEGAIVVCNASLSAKALCHLVQLVRHIHGRSGSVALPRVKVVPAMAARLVAAGPEERRAVRRALLRRRVVDMIAAVSGCYLSQLVWVFVKGTMKRASMECWSFGFEALAISPTSFHPKDRRSNERQGEQKWALLIDRSLYLERALAYTHMYTIPSYEVRASTWLAQMCPNITLAFVYTPRKAHIHVEQGGHRNTERQCSRRGETTVKTLHIIRLVIYVR